MVTPKTNSCAVSTSTSRKITKDLKTCLSGEVLFLMGRFQYLTPIIGLSLSKMHGGRAVCEISKEVTHVVIGSADERLTCEAGWTKIPSWSEEEFLSTILWTPSMIQSRFRRLAGYVGSEAGQKLTQGDEASRDSPNSGSDQEDVTHSSGRESHSSDSKLHSSVSPSAGNASTGGLKKDVPSAEKGSADPVAHQSQQASETTLATHGSFKTIYSRPTSEDLGPEAFKISVVPKSEVYHVYEKSLRSVKQYFLSTPTTSDDHRAKRQQLLDALYDEFALIDQYCFEAVSPH